MGEGVFNLVMLAQPYFPLLSPFARGAACQDLGADHFARTNRTRVTTRYADKLQELGFNVTLTEEKAA